MPQLSYNQRNQRGRQARPGTHQQKEQNKNQESEPSNDGLEIISSIAVNCTRLLVFLWAIANGMGSEVSQADPPEVPITDAMMQQIHQEVMGAPTQIPAPAGMPTNIPRLAGGGRKPLDACPDPEHERHGQSRPPSSQARREEDLHDIPTLGRAAGLFHPPLSTRLEDDHPRLSAFASQLLSDKDPWKAHSLITSETRSWRGMVCKRGITQFFCMGYAAVDISVRPGEFAIFMFRPKSVGNTQSQSTIGSRP
jgi:hypothetical protein